MRISLATPSVAMVHKGTGVFRSAAMRKISGTSTCPPNSTSTPNC